MHKLLIFACSVVIIDFMLDFDCSVVMLGKSYKMLC